MRILVNGINAKSGGGKSIFNNLLKVAALAQVSDEFIVISPDYEEYKKFEQPNIKLIKVSPFFQNNIVYFFFYFFYLNRILIKNKIDVLLNLGDIIAATKVKQVYLFDWAYAVYPESLVWQRMGPKERLARKFKIALISLYIQKIRLVIAQTKVTAFRLKSVFKLKNIEIIPNGVSLDHFSTDQTRVFMFPDNKFKLLYLTRYYTHKNLEIFIPLAQLIKQRNLPYLIITTIDEDQHALAKVFLAKVKDLGLLDIIQNVGSVKLSDVPSIYQQTDSLLMPTLLEYFSGTYLDAMYHEKIIITSDFDFSREVCGDNALYFNALDEFDILGKITDAHKNTDASREMITRARESLNLYESWEVNLEKILVLIKNI